MPEEFGRLSGNGPDRYPPLLRRLSGRGDPTARNPLGAGSCAAAAAMHILLIHQLFMVTGDAGMTQHVDFARHLVRRGHRVTVISGTHSYLTGRRLSVSSRRVLEPGLEIVPYPVWGSVHRSFLLRALGFASFVLTSFWGGLRQRRVDVVWSTSPPLPQILTAWAVSALKRVPLVFEIRDLWPEVAVQMGVLRNPALRWIAEAAERFLYRNARRLVVNSPGFVPHLTERGVPESRIRIVPNGVNLTPHDPTDRGLAFRAAHGLGDRFIALYAGAHGMANHLENVLLAAERLREDPRILFVLVGDGKQKPQLISLAEQRQLPNVRFLPPVARDNMDSVLAAADCGIATLLPIPLFTTTYPNKVFDYMAASRPVVLAIDGTIRALVEEVGAGLFVPMGDPAAMAEAVRTLADNPDRARAMGGRGRKCVEDRFDRAEMARRLEAVLQEALAR